MCWLGLCQAGQKRKKCGISGGNHDEGTLLWKLGPTWNYNSKWMDLECEDWIYVTKDRQIAGNCEHINEASESVNSCDFID
jgi:hypothetical protein